MVVECPDCGLRYDDVYRLTLCPHDRFEMATAVYRGAEFVGIATSVPELRRMLGEDAPPPALRAVG
jgi:hypothetical protein